jgi:predicted nuclease of restriction endonuclease-like RecB superfamily
MEDAIINEPFKHALVDFAIEYPDGRRAILEIVGFWMSEYLESKLTKIRQREANNFVLAVSGRLHCASKEFGATADRVLWFKTGVTSVTSST